MESLDELQDREALTIGEDALSRLGIPVRLTDGSESPPVFRRAIDRLTELIPQVTRETIEGAAHVPHFTVPDRYVELTTRAVLQHAAALRAARARFASCFRAAFPGDGQAAPVWGGRVRSGGRVPPRRCLVMTAAS